MPIARGRSLSEKRTATTESGHDRERRTGDAKDGPRAMNASGFGA